MAKATEIDIEARAKAGRENFLKGYNCAQSVIAAFAVCLCLPDLKTAAPPPAIWRHAPETMPWCRNWRGSSKRKTTR